MTVVIWTVKNLLLPGSLSFLLLGAALGILLLYGSERSRVWGRRWLLALVAGYWVLSVPVGAALIVNAIGYGYRPLASASDAHGATAVVVLDATTVRVRAPGGRIDMVSVASAFRAIEAARVYRLLGDPLVIVSGGTTESQSPSGPEVGALRDELVKAGVPLHRIVLDSDSPNTRAQAVNLAPVLRAHRVTRAVLVTSLTHIRRAAQTFRAAGIDVVPSPAAVTNRWRLTEWWPGRVWLQLSEDGLRDALGILYYSVRGWVAKP